MQPATLTDSKRDRRIDSMRGLLLVLMTIGHFDSIITRYTFECFGFFSVAEGFIFLSAFVFAGMHARLADDPRTLLKVGLKKAFLIYRYHLALAILLPLAAFAIPIFKVTWGMFLGSPFYEKPLLTMVYEIFLLYQPRFMDILPMYCIFTLLGPLILIGFRAGRAAVVLAISFGLWILGQYVDPMVLLAGVVPGLKPGSFNLTAWQLIWVGGMALGFMHQTGRPLPLMRNKPFLYTVALLAVVLFLARHGWIGLAFNTIPASQKPNLSWLRLLNFGIIVTTIGWLIRRIPRNRGVPWLGFLGRHSLQVFSYQVLLLYLLFPIAIWMNQSGRYDAYAWLNVAIVISLSIPAGLHAWYKARRSRRQARPRCQCQKPVEDSHSA